jgi:hypothetical protein
MAKTKPATAGSAVGIAPSPCLQHSRQCPLPEPETDDLADATEDWWNHHELGRIARYYRAHPGKLTARVRERIQALYEVLGVKP